MSHVDYVRQEHHAFLKASDEALSNPALQHILDKLGDSLGQKNKDAWDAFEQHDLVRQRARAIKDDTLAALDKHLATLEESVTRRGGHVYWAENGEEASGFILDMIQSRGAKKVVKSKSMTSEEIHLNKTLEKHQIEVVETDFGEYIIQVAGHRPSHIVGPALHLSKDDVAEILSEEAGEELPSNREALAAFARRTLRSRFAGRSYTAQSISRMLAIPFPAWSPA